MAQRTLNRRSRRDDIEDDYTSPPATVDEDDEPPRRRGRSRREDPEEERTPRSRRSSEDEDEPRKRSSAKGWGGYQEARKSTRSTDYIENYKLPESQELIKFLDEEPFAVYNEHWIDEARKKSWACIGDDCPLCNTGDRAKTYAMLNVIDLRAGQEPRVCPLKASPMVADLLEGYASDKKTSPLNRDDLYFAVEKKGGGQKGRVQVILTPVKSRDLADDWEIDPLTPAEIEEFEAQAYSEEDVVTYASRKTLKAVADELD